MNRELMFHDSVVRVYEDGALKYEDSKDNFEVDFAVVLDPLPQGKVSFHYRQDERIMVYYDAKGNAFPIEGAFELLKYNDCQTQCTPALVKQQVRVDYEVALEMDAVLERRKEAFRAEIFQAIG